MAQTLFPLTFYSVFSVTTRTESKTNITETLANDGLRGYEITEVYTNSTWILGHTIRGGPSPCRYVNQTKSVPATWLSYTDRRIFHYVATVIYAHSACYPNRTTMYCDRTFGCPIDKYVWLCIYNLVDIHFYGETCTTDAAHWLYRTSIYA